MIKDVKAGNVEERDAVCALLFINLFHSLIEDTSLVMLLGPSLFVILFFRAIFVICLAYVMIKLINITPNWFFYNFIVNKKAFGQKV